MIRGLRSKQIWINDRWQSADLLFDEHGLIEAIKDYKSAEIDLIDHGALSVIPGLVDTHVHFNEPGREDWEGVSSGTAAAAAGGITTVVDMPLNSSPVTTTPETVGAKIAAVESKLSIDFAMHGGLVPENCDKMDALIQSGVLGIKAFLCPSGIDEFGHVGRKELEIAMPAIAASGLPLLVHAEVVHEVEVTSDPRNHGDYAATRPPSFERNAIEMMIELVEQTGCKVHIVHLADAGSIPALAAARGEGLPITVET
ncbi:MAG: amidohydrolase family protein, partial [Planctomycetota bacterium]